MPLIPELIERPVSGSIDGVNQDFEMATAYVPDSIRVYLNGQLKCGTDNDGWIEQGGKKFRLKEAPETGEVIQVRYVPV
jgi:hypothetical protein